MLVEAYDPGDRSRERKRAERAWADAAETAAGGEALLVSPEGLVGETTRANVFAILGDVIVTPAVTGLLPGVTRSWAIERLGAIERALTLAELREADGAFVTTAGRGVVALADVGGSGSRSHPLVEQLRGGVAGAVIVILDNRDSFVLNVQHRLWEIGVDSVVVPSHATRLDEIEDLRSGRDHRLARAAGARRGRHLDGRDPRVRGPRAGARHLPRAPVHRRRARGRVAPNANACHGRASPIEHDGRGVLEGLPSPFDAGRYHALAADEPPSGLAAPGVGPARRRLGPRDGPAPPDAADRGRAVPPGERAHAARVRHPRAVRPAGRARAGQPRYVKVDLPIIVP